MPLLFLFITKGLIRYILDDPEFKGINIGETEHKLSCFADDTMLALRNYAAIPHVFDTILPMYEAATGMRVNVTKTEGLQLGALRRQPPPTEALRGGSWCEEGDFITSLGVPIGNNYDEAAFWLTKYNKAKSLDGPLA